MKAMASLLPTTGDPMPQAVATDRYPAMRRASPPMAVSRFISGKITGCRNWEGLRGRAEDGGLGGRNFSKIRTSADICGHLRILVGIGHTPWLRSRPLGAIICADLRGFDPIGVKSAGSGRIAQLRAILVNQDEKPSK